MAGRIRGGREGDMEAWDAEQHPWSPRRCDAQDAAAVRAEVRGRKPLAGGHGCGREEEPRTEATQTFFGGGTCTQSSRSEDVTRNRKAEGAWRLGQIRTSVKECMADAANCPESQKLEMWCGKMALRQVVTVVMMLLPLAFGELVASRVLGCGAGPWKNTTWTSLAEQYPMCTVGQEAGDEVSKALSRWLCGCDLPFALDPYWSMFDVRYRTVLSALSGAVFVRKMTKRRYTDIISDLFVLGILGCTCYFLNTLV